MQTSTDDGKAPISPERLSEIERALEKIARERHERAERIRMAAGKLVEDGTFPSVTYDEASDKVIFAWPGVGPKVIWRAEQFIKHFITFASEKPYLSLVITQE